MANQRILLQTKNISRAIGIAFILISLFIVYSSTLNFKYDVQGNNFDPSKENFVKYSNVDGVGVEYFIKQTSFLNTSPQVLTVIVFSLFFGIILILMPNMFIFTTNRNFELKKFLIYIVSMVFIAFIIEKLYLKFLFKNYSVQIMFSVLILITLVILLRLWRYWDKKILLIIAIVLCFYQGIGLLIELGNYIAPAFIHEGNWALVDSNSIAIYNKSFQHNYSFGYIVFRLLNLILLLASSYLVYNFNSQKIIQK